MLSSGSVVTTMGQMGSRVGRISATAAFDSGEGQPQNERVEELLGQSRRTAALWRSRCGRCGAPLMSIEKAKHFRTHPAAND